MAISKKMRQQVLNKYSGRCAYCGCDIQLKGMHVDHMLPIRRSKDYSLTLAKWIDTEPSHPERDCIENMMPSCASCNINKHRMSIEDFRGMIAGFIRSLNERITQYKIAKRYGLIQETPKEIKFYYETFGSTPTVQECDATDGDSK